MIPNNSDETTKKRKRPGNVWFLVQLTGSRPSCGVHDATIDRAIVMGPPERLSVYLTTRTGYRFRWDMELDASQAAARELERLQEIAKRDRPNDSSEFDGATVGMRFDRGRFVQFEAVSPPRQAPGVKASGDTHDSSKEVTQ